MKYFNRVSSKDMNGKPVFINVNDTKGIFMFPTKDEEYDVYFIDSSSHGHTEIEFVKECIVSDNIAFLSCKKGRAKYNMFLNLKSGEFIPVPIVLKTAEDVDLVLLPNGNNGEKVYASARISSGFKENFITFRYDFENGVIAGIYSSVKDKVVKNTTGNLYDVIKQEQACEKEVLECFDSMGIKIHDRSIEKSLSLGQRKEYFENKKVGE